MRNSSLRWRMLLETVDRRAGFSESGYAATKRFCTVRVGVLKREDEYCI